MSSSTSNINNNNNNIISSLESSSRSTLLQHECDNFNLLLDLFSASTQTLLGHNKNRSLSRSIENLKQAVDTERELYANVRGKLDRESFEKSSVEKMSHQAVEWCEYWRKRASDNAQELREMTEAKDLAHDAALFWKARCVCATAALKQLTEGSGDFDYSTYGANMATLLHDDIPVPTRKSGGGGGVSNLFANNQQQQQQQYPARRGSSQTSASKRNQSSNSHSGKQKDKKEKKDKKRKEKHRQYDNESDNDYLRVISDQQQQQQTASILGTSLPVRMRHPDLFTYVEEGQNFATNYLYHNTQQQVHPSHKPSKRY